ncbi:hypothetical protein YC2023_080405 [Brassica napus]
MKVTLSSIPQNNKKRYQKSRNKGHLLNCSQKWKTPSYFFEFSSFFLFNRVSDKFETDEDGPSR